MDLSKNFFQQVFQLLPEIRYAHGPTLGIAATCIVLMLGQYVLKKRWKVLGLVPMPFLIMILSIIMSKAIDFDSKGIVIVKDLEGGFPPLSVPVFPEGKVWDLIENGVLIGLVCYIETISIGYKYALLNNYKVIPNQELLAVGMGNFLGAFTSSYPSAGSYARTPINAEAGAKSQFAELVTLILVMIAMNTLTDILYYLPRVVLASIVVVSGKFIYFLFNLKI